VRFHTLPLLLLLSLMLTRAMAQDAAPPLSGQAPEGTVAAAPDQAVPSPADGETTTTATAQPGQIQWLAGPPAPGQQVYVRLRGEALKGALTGQPWEVLAEINGKTSRIDAKLELVPNLHEVSAALGPMRSAPGGESIWPLLFESERLPIKKLKLRVRQPDTTALPSIQLTRLNADGSIADVVAEMAEPPARLSPAPPGPVWLEPAPQVRPGVWAVVVGDQGPPLQLQRITAYAAELCLTFTMPDAGDPVLHQADAKGSEMTALDSLVPTPAPVEISGEVSNLAPVVAESGLMSSIFSQKRKSTKASESGASGTGSGPGPNSSLLLGIVYGAAGMALLIGGINLLRRKLPAD
jgi:hypothetical protein